MPRNARLVRSTSSTPSAIPLVVPEIEFGKIPLQMLLADVVIYADDAALQDPKVSFRRVRVGIAPHILFDRMIDRGVAREAVADPDIDRAAVGAEMRILGNGVYKDRLQSCRGDIGDVVRTYLAAALDQRHDSFLVRNGSISPVLRLAADIGFVRLNELTFATKASRQLTFAHRFADTMAHEPCGFQCDAKGPVKLIAADTLFRRAQQEHRLKPDMQLDVAGLEDGPHLNGEGLAAGIALVDADPGALALQRTAFVEHAAMRANAPVRPDVRLHESVGGGLAVVLRLGQDGHGLSPWPISYPSRLGTATIILPIFIIDCALTVVDR
jgi:hypothetical protein